MPLFFFFFSPQSCCALFCSFYFLLCTASWVQNPSLSWLWTCVSHITSTPSRRCTNCSYHLLNATRTGSCRSRFCPPVSCGIQFPVRARVAISEIGYGSIVTAWCHWGIGSEKVSVPYRKRHTPRPKQTHCLIPSPVCVCVHFYSSPGYILFSYNPAGSYHTLWRNKPPG